MEIVLLVGGIFLIVAVIVAVKVSQSKKMEDSGAIIKRKSGFWNQRYYFILKHGDFGRVAQAFQTQEKSQFASQIIPEKQTIAFQGATWKGHLKAEPAPGYMFVYSFVISSYQARNGIPHNFVTMNAALTACEKALLSIDPMTQVGSKARTSKTTPSFL